MSSPIFLSFTVGFADCLLVCKVNVSQQWVWFSAQKYILHERRAHSQMGSDLVPSTGEFHPLAHSPFLSEKAPKADVNPAIMTILQNNGWKASVWKDYDISTKLIANTYSGPPCVRSPLEKKMWTGKCLDFRYRVLLWAGLPLDEGRPISGIIYWGETPCFSLIINRHKHTGTDDVFRWSLFHQFSFLVESRIFNYFVFSSVKG